MRTREKDNAYSANPNKRTTCSLGDLVDALLKGEMLLPHAVPCFELASKDFRACMVCRETALAYKLSWCMRNKEQGSFIKPAC